MPALKSLRSIRELVSRTFLALLFTQPTFICGNYLGLPNHVTCFRPTGARHTVSVMAIIVPVTTISAADKETAVKIALAKITPIAFAVRSKAKTSGRFWGGELSL